MPISKDGNSADKSHSKGTRENRPLRVNLPDRLPELTPEVSRVLLSILLELKDSMDQQERAHIESTTKPDAGAPTN